MANINSTYYGGGVAELLSSLTLLMNSTGIKTGWRVMLGAPDFFSITKTMHGGIRYQIEDGINGFLVYLLQEAADRIVHVLKDEKLREQMGRRARETVQQNFLLTRYLEQYLDLLNSFETIYRLRT